MGRFAFRFVVLLVVCSILISFSRFNIVKASGNTIYIRADGSIDPPTAPISTTDNVTYTLTGNITIYVINTDGIDIRRDNIVVDGAGYSVQGAEGGAGIALSGRSNVTIKNMVITAFGYGIWLSYSSNNSIAGNNITNNWNGIVLEYSSNNSISGNNITANDDMGISLYFSPNNTICKNNVTKSYEYGIRLSSSSQNFIFGNNITENGIGVRLFKSSNNKIFGNNIAENGWGGGINLYISNGNNITGNTVTHNSKGIFLEYSGHNDVSGNVIADNHYGVILKISTGNVLRSNNMTDNSYNMGIYGIDDDLFHFGSVSLSSFLQDIDSSNTVNGNPICYWVNQHGNRIPDNAGFVAVINCTEITVSNIRPTKNVQGILLACTRNSVLQNLTATDNEVGVHLVGSDNNTITANNVTKNKFGISLYYSSRNNFIQNIVTENPYFGVGIGIGLALESSMMFPPTTITSEGNLFRGNLISSNTYWKGGLTLFNPGTRYTIITENNITNNRNGIYLRESSNNIIYHNNFVDNNPQVYIETSGYANFWDNGVEGNYWNNYTGVDSDYNGIGDTPYVMDANNQDNHPLMGIFHSFNTSYDIQVNIISNSSISNFDFNLVNQTHAELTFNVTGDNESEGFCRICIPKILINGSYIVKFNGEVITHPHVRELPCSNETHEYLYINYTHSEHTIEISGTTLIPEFPSALIMPLIMLTTPLVITIYRRKRSLR